MRQVLRLFDRERSTVETLMLKGNLIKCGLAEAAISLIPDDILGNQAAEFLVGLIQVSEEVLTQARGSVSTPKYAARRRFRHCAWSVGAAA